MSMDDKSAALNVIGRKLRIKEEIDKPFDESTLKDENFIIEESGENNIAPKTLSYKLNSKDAGLNCLCELNLGKAFKYRCDVAEDGTIYNEKRERYPKDYIEAMNEKWLDYTLEQIKKATNPIVIISDIFTRRTTGNYQEVLPYEEQLRYIYKKLNDENIKSKIVAFVRGQKEQEILKYSEQDLMGKLVKMLGMEERLVDSGFHLSVKTNSGANKNAISLLHFVKKTNSIRALFKSMQVFANENPGHDIYYCTNCKQNAYFSGVTTCIDNKGNAVQKPCWFISFGPMYEYDRFNCKRPELGPYTLNKSWYKLSMTKDGFVRADTVDYVYPRPENIDSSNYTASVIVNEFADEVKNMILQGTKELDKNLKNTKEAIRKETVTTIKSKHNKVSKTEKEESEELAK